jgi:hypothetical protein
VRALTRDETLDDITLYWITNTGTSSARLHWENNANNFNAVDISVPAAVTVFPGEIYRRHEPGPRAAITSSSISTRSTRAGASRGNGRNSSRAKSAQRSDHCANGGEAADAHSVRVGDRNEPEAD